MALTTRMSYGRYCDEIAAETVTVTDLIVDHDGAVPVPTCPGWTVADMSAHLTTALAWPESLVRNRHLEFVPPPGLGDTANWSSDVAGLATSEVRDRADAAAAIRKASEELCATLLDAGPDVPVWRPFGEPCARYWATWALNEMLVHRVDLEIAVGGREDPTTVPEAAADLMWIFLEAMTLDVTRPFSSPLRDGLGGNGEVIRLVSTDTRAGGEWRLELVPGGVAWTGTHREDVTVIGRAVDLLLLVKGRLRPGTPEWRRRLVHQGDIGLVEHWQGHAIS